MAYGLRLRIQYYDYKNVYAQINIYQRDYGGTADVRDGQGMPFKLTAGKKSGNDLRPVYGSTASVAYIGEEGFEFSDLYTTDSRKHKVELKKDGVIKWLGFIEPEQWGEPLLQALFEISFTAYDGLGWLKNEDFVDENGDDYEGEKTLLEILTICLEKTGLDLVFNTAISIRETTQATGVDPLTQIKKDVVSYLDLSCYEVLEQIFQGCRIFQRDGEWFVVSLDQLKATSYTSYRYDYQGNSLGTASKGGKTTISQFDSRPYFETMPALKQMSIKQDYGFKSNLINNASFNSLNSDGTFEDWTAVGTTPEQRILNSDGDRFIFLPGGEWVGFSDAWKTYNHAKWLKAETINVEATASIPTINVDYALMQLPGSPVVGSANLFFGIHLIGNSGTEYSLQAILDGDNKITLEWQTTNSILGVPLGVRVDNDGIGNYSLAITPSVAYDYDEVIEHFKSASLSVKNGIPENGQMSFYLFLASTSVSLSHVGACFSKAGLKFADSEDEQIPTDTQFLLINDKNNNYIPDELDYINGDTPDVNNQIVIYEGHFLNVSDSLPTSLWKIDGITGTYTFVELIARFLASNMRQPRQAYQCRIYDMPFSSAMLIEDANNSNKLLIESGVTYNDRTQVIDGRYVEVLEDSLTSFTVGEEINYSKSGSTGSSNKSPVINTDEQVQLMTAEFEKVGAPGYLHFDEFEAQTDETTGQTLITHKPLLIDQNYKEGRTLPSATGDNAIAIGEGTTAETMRQITMGSFNDAATGTADSWVATDPLVVVGNGADTDNKATAHTIYKSGYQVTTNAIALGAFSWGSNNPVDGSLQYTSGSQFEGYYAAAWHRFWTDSDFAQTDIDNWNTAYGWGDHAAMNYATQSWVNALSVSTFSNDAGYITAASLHPAMTLTTDDTQILSASGQDLTFNSGNIPVPNFQSVTDVGNSTTNNIGIGISPDYPIHISKNTTYNSDSKSLLIDGNYMDNLYNQHPLRISTNHYLGAGKAFATFDAMSNSEGTNNMLHMVGFQSRNTHNSSGTMGQAYDFYAATVNNGGNIGDRYGMRVVDLSGSGTASNQYGIYIENLTKATNNWGIYSVGTTKSYFGGKIGINDTNPSRMLTISDSSTPTFGMKVSGVEKFVILADTAGGTIQAKNNSDFKIVDDSSDGIHIKDGGNASFDKEIQVNNIKVIDTNSNYFLQNNRALYSSDSGSTSRRMLLLSASNNSYFGPIDTGWGAVTYFSAGSGIIFRTNGASGSFTDAVTISGSTANATFSANVNSLGSYQLSGTNLHLDAHKSGSLGASGYFYRGAGITSTPTWDAPSSIGISGFNNDAGYLADAPSDDSKYSRLNGAWSAISEGITYSKGTGIDITGSTISIDVPSLSLMGSPALATGDFIIVYDTSIGAHYKMEASTILNYYWNLYVDGDNKGTVAKGEIVDFKAGSGMSLVYNSGDGSITLNSSASSYSEGSGIDITGGTISLDIAGLSNAAPSSDAVSFAFYDPSLTANRKMTMSTLANAMDVGNALELQGRTLASTAPSTGQAIAWNGSQWEPTTISGGSGLWQDLTGVIAPDNTSDLVRIGTASAIGTANLQVNGTLAMTSALRFFSNSKWNQIDSISAAGVMRLSVNASSEVGTYSEGLRLDGPNQRVRCGLEKFKVPVRTSDPSGEVGDIYFNSSTDKFRGYTSSGWGNLN